jgi:hypothetical protein
MRVGVSFATRVENKSADAMAAPADLEPKLNG